LYIYTSWQSWQWLTASGARSTRVRHGQWNSIYELGVTCHTRQYSAIRLRNAHVASLFLWYAVTKTIYLPAPLRLFSLTVVGRSRPCQAAWSTQRTCCSRCYCASICRVCWFNSIINQRWRSPTSSPYQSDSVPCRGALRSIPTTPSPYILPCTLAAWRVWATYKSAKFGPNNLITVNFCSNIVSEKT